MILDELAHRVKGDQGKVRSCRIQNVYLLLPESESDSRRDCANSRPENEFSKLLAGYKVDERSSDLCRVFAMIKSPYELKMLQHAIDISTEAQMRAMADGRAGEDGI